LRAEVACFCEGTGKQGRASVSHDAGRSPPEDLHGPPGGHAQRPLVNRLDPANDEDGRPILMLTGEGDMGEADLLEPSNDNDSVERVDASAFQDLDNPELYTRRLSLFETCNQTDLNFRLPAHLLSLSGAATSYPSS
jgi:hypothetical protein